MIQSAFFVLDSKTVTVKNIEIRAAYDTVFAGWHVINDVDRSFVVEKWQGFGRYNFEI